MAKGTDNFLQSLDKSANIKFGMLYSEIESELRKEFSDFLLKNRTNPQTIDKTVHELFKSKQYRKRLEDIVVDASVKAVERGLGDGFALLSVDKYAEHQLYKSYGGVKLSEIIRDNAQEAERLISATVKGQLREGTNWKRLSAEINKLDKVADVSTKIADLAASGKRVLTSPADVKALERQVRDAQRYVKTLSPSAPVNGKLRKAYQAVIDAVESKSSTAIDKAVDRAFKAKINYNNDRIARTELARAYEQGFKRSLEEDEFATGFKWELSNNHPRPDICDYYAEIDNGSGAGVWLKDDIPELPAHPNCLCFLTKWYGEKPQKATIKNSVEFLEKQPKQKREQIIGVGNAEYRSKYKNGLQNNGVDFGKKHPVVKPLLKSLIKGVKDES